MTTTHRPHPDRPELPDADPRVVALAREVERANRRVSELDTLVRHLGEDLTALAADLTDNADHPPLPSWLAADDPDRGRELLTDLTDWLARVYLRYPDAALPSCWAWHPTAVEELSWLRRAHRAAYDGPRASWREIGDWHDRQRPGVVRRLRPLVDGCELIRHTPGGDRTDTAPVAPLTGHTDPVAEHWTTHRTAPDPTPQQLTDAEHHDRPLRRY